MKVRSCVISAALIFTLSTQLFSCGYVFRPERRGQTSGKIDWAIVGLDAIGLLFFVIPGLIAFAVDIASGTIYMPAGTPGITAQNWSGGKVIKLDPNEMSEEKIIAAIEENTGIKVDLNDPRLQIFRDKKLEAQLASR